MDDLNGVEKCSGNFNQYETYFACIFKKLNEFERKYNNYKEKYGGNVYLIKYHESTSLLLKKLSPSEVNEVNRIDVETILKLYAQAVLDFTYFEENRLVDDEFSSSDATAIINEIIFELSEVDSLHAQSSSLTLVEVLGAESVECLNWRKGALLYMYCHTIYNDKRRQLQNIQNLLRYTKMGVGYLQTMLDVRCKNRTCEESDSTDDDSQALLNLGIFGDTHMLAAMYGGEMCYWFWQLSKSNKNFTNGNEFKDVRKIAEDLLGIYARAADGPLKSMGWTSVRAKEIVQEMRSHIR